VEPIGPKRMLDQTTWLQRVSAKCNIDLVLPSVANDLRVGELSLGIGGDARGLGAVSTGGAGLALLLGWVGGVEPEHVGVVLWRGMENVR
jgi:hypothetical protein